MLCQFVIFQKQSKAFQPFNDSSPQLHGIVHKLKLTFRSIEYFIIVLLFVLLFVLVHICINSPITLASAPLSGVPGLSYSWHWDPYPSPPLSSRTQFANIITVISDMITTILGYFTQIFGNYSQIDLTFIFFAFGSVSFPSYYPQRLNLRASSLSSMAMI